MLPMRLPLLLGLIVGLSACPPLGAQFLDEFEDPALTGWTFFTGDGNAAMQFRPEDGAGVILVTPPGTVATSGGP